MFFSAEDRKNNFLDRWLVLLKKNKPFVALTTHDCNSSLSLSSVQGIAQIKNEVEDLGEPLIDGIHGHGRYAPCMRISIFQRNSLKVASSHLAWTLIFAVKV